MKAKRVVSLVLAFLMVMGTVVWIISMVAGASNGTMLTPTATGVVPRITNTSITRNTVLEGSVVVEEIFSLATEAQALADSINNNEFGVNVNPGSFTAKTLPTGSVKLLGVETTTAPFKVSYKVDITEDMDIKYTGNGNTLSLSAYNTSDLSFYQNTISVTLSQAVPYTPSTNTGSDYDDDDDDVSVDLPEPTPYVIISDYSYGGGEVLAGQSFTLNITLNNTSLLDVGNMVVTISTPEAFTLVNSSNTFYIPSMAAKSTLTRSITMQVRAAASPEPAAVEVAMSYQYRDNDTRNDVSRTESISIPVAQQDRFSVTPPTLPDMMYVGEEFPIEVSYTNKGRSTVYNLSGSIDGNILTPGQLDNVGNIESGSSGTFDFFLEPMQAGILTGNIVIVYEDINMNENVVTLPYSIEVMDMSMGGDEGMFDPTMGGDMYFDENGNMVGPDGTVYGPDGMPIEQGGISIWVWVAIGGGLLAAIIVIVVVHKKRKAARLLAELEEDDDENI